MSSNYFWVWWLSFFKSMWKSEFSVNFFFCYFSLMTFYHNKNIYHNNLNFSDTYFEKAILRETIQKNVSFFKFLGKPRKIRQKINIAIVFSYEFTSKWWALPKCCIIFLGHVRPFFELLEILSISLFCKKFQRVVN